MAVDNREMIVLGPRNCSVSLSELVDCTEYVNRFGWLGLYMSSERT